MPCWCEGSEGNGENGNTGSDDRKATVTLITPYNQGVQNHISKRMIGGIGMIGGPAAPAWRCHVRGCKLHLIHLMSSSVQQLTMWHLFSSKCTLFCRCRCKKLQKTCFSSICMCIRQWTSPPSGTCHHRNSSDRTSDLDQRYRRRGVFPVITTGVDFQRLKRLEPIPQPLPNFRCIWSVDCLMLNRS